MAAASSGEHSRPPLGRRLPHYMDPTNEFGQLTFLQLTGKNDAPLPKNPFIIGTSVEKAAGGPIEGATTEAQGTRYTLKVRNPAQVEKLLSMTKLLDGTDIIVQAHPNLNISRCVISCFDLIHMEEDDILNGLLSQGVIKVQRITKKQNGERVNSPALILTFNKSTYPAHVRIGLLRTSTRPYYPNPLLCYGCFRFGHPRARCPGPQRCFNCSAEHQVEECGETAFCLNCRGSHRPNSRECPVYKQEQQVIRIKVDNNLTYPEARKRVNNDRGSYAAAVNEQNQDRLKLNELAKQIKEKDIQIAQLLEATKKKDEQMEKMMTYIKNMKTQYEGTHTETQQMKNPRKTQIANSTMQLRSRSPVTAETKRGETSKKPKRPNETGNRKTETSPDRLSPPPKKTNAEETEHSDGEVVELNEDYEIGEMPPNHPIRRS